MTQKRRSVAIVVTGVLARKMKNAVTMARVKNHVNLNQIQKRVTEQPSNARLIALLYAEIITEKSTKMKPIGLTLYVHMV